MIELVREPFDSDLWKKNVYKLHAQSPFPSSAELRATLEKERPDIICAFTPFAPSFTSALEENGFHFTSIRSTYEWKGTMGDVPSVADGIRIVSLAHAPSFSNPELEEIARTIGGTSRYMNDPRIPEQDALALYLTWLQNSLTKGYVNELFIALQDKRIVGLITLKIKQRTGTIDLIGVVPSHQGKGLGRFLLQRGMQYLQSEGVEHIQVITEGENITANAFYQRNGFLVQQLVLVYHSHPAYD